MEEDKSKTLSYSSNTPLGMVKSSLVPTPHRPCRNVCRHANLVVPDATSKWLEAVCARGRSIHMQQLSPREECFKVA